MSKKLPKTQKRKISETLKKIYASGERKPAMLGKTASKETRKKMSDARIGKKFSIKWRRNMSLAKMGDKNPAKRPDVKKKNSMAQKKWWANPKNKNKILERNKKISETTQGKGGNNWKGGKSFEPYGIEFNNRLKETIRKRDNYRCQECFRHQSELRTKNNNLYKLIIHHIDFNKKNNDLSNLISLCRPCHLQTNFNREKWIDYFQNKINEITNR